jgi:hypothetical protein
VIIRVARANVSGPTPGSPEEVVDNRRRVLTEWDSFSDRQRRAIRALIRFEVWNVAVIAVSLAGFNHVSVLASFPWALWMPVALITAGVTGWSVYAWTRE